MDVEVFKLINTYMSSIRFMQPVIFVTNSYTCMVSPGTHFVKNNFMCPSPETNESREVKKKRL